MVMPRVKKEGRFLVSSVTGRRRRWWPGERGTLCEEGEKSRGGPLCRASANGDGGDFASCSNTSAWNKTQTQNELLTHYLLCVLFELCLRAF